MTSDVVLTAALRNNLLSLQNTQSSIDATQFRLASGKKVSSALDGPQSFFAAQALNNRASDLTRLLDGIGQSIQVIKAADNGVTALTTLVEQADSIAANARDVLSSGEVEAKITGNVDLSGIEDLTDLAGITDGGTDTLVFSLTDENGTVVQLGAYGGALGNTASVTLAANTSTEELISAINNLHVSDFATAATASGEQAFEASLDASGQLVIRGLTGDRFNIQFQTVADTDPANLAVAQELGFGDLAQLVADAGGAANNNVQITAIPDVALRSYALYDSSVTPKTVATRGDLITDLETENSATNLFQNIDNASDDYLIGVNGGAQQSIELFRNGGAITIQEFIDQINNNVTLNTQIEADFDDETGQVVIRSINADVQTIQVGVAGSAQTANFGFGQNTDLTGAAGVDEVESIALAAAASTLATLESDYNRVRDQITELVTNGDTAYRGTNLLNGDDLLTNFNENRTSSLTTSGVSFTADGLGLDEANFNTTAAVDDLLDQTRAALETIRSFGSTLANDLTIIQTRQTFTQNTINTLTEGADKLTLADQNEEGAKLLALQTRQQLAVTSLALASQSQQAVLRLF